MIPHDTHLHIGSLLFEGVDQIDLTGPFEVLSRLSNSTYRSYGKTNEPVRDVRGLRLAPDAALADAPPLDILHVPGGLGQEALMEDTEVLAWIRQQAVFAAGVTAGIDGALRLAAELRGDEAAQAIQLHMAYAPEPPFNAGTPETAPAAILAQARQSVRDVTARRERTARRIAARLGIAVPAVAGQ
jgi:cyclohexyl-isocyanide hydratase